jgi:ubiquinone/menaquinone biosynthesis C-methylase UbiE
MVVDPTKQKREMRRASDRQAPTFDAGFLALLRPATLRLIDAARIEPDDRVLDVACGTGMQSFVAARRLSDRGALVGIDLSERLVEVARSKAIRLGLGNVRFEAMDAEALAVEDASFDVVLCQQGLFLFPDPARALEEMRRVLRPGGRIALMVTGAKERCDFLTLPRRVGEELGILQPRAPNDPGDHRYGTAELLSKTLADHGFLRPRTTAYALQIQVPSGEVYWDLFAACAGRFEVLLNQLAQDARNRFIGEVKRRVDALPKPATMSFEVIVGGAWAPGEPRRRAPVDATGRAIEETLALAPAEAHAMREKGAVLVDIRQPDERRSTIPGSVHIPRGRLEAEIDRFVVDPAVPILLISGSGRRSALAAASLRRMGYRRVAGVAGGFEKWAETLPVRQT